MLVTELSHLLHLLLAFLEAAEVVLDEERRVELSDGDLIVSGRRNHLVQQLWTRSLPHLLNHGAQLFVRLVDVTCTATYATNLNCHRRHNNPNAIYK